MVENDERKNQHEGRKRKGKTEMDGKGISLELFYLVYAIAYM